MKNSNDPGQSKYDPASAVSVTIDEAPLLKNLVEKLAHRHCSSGQCNAIVPDGWKAMETSSIEAYVSGCMDIQEQKEYIALSYTTCFSFTCTKVLGGDNTLAWVNSLS
ncbi:MAG: hypothetical protein ACHQFX_10175 [Chitinophagales bacterium]